MTPPIKKNPTKFKDMEKDEKGKRFAILETNKYTKKKMLYTSMTKYCDAHPELKREKLAYYITRKKVAFEDSRIILERVQYFDLPLSGRTP